jgi:simple sugar transport system ATP-binding protein
MQPAFIKGMAGDLLGRFDVRPPDPQAPARSLSGGNQQKLVLARVLGADPKLLLASQPTRGLDVGAIEFVHREIRTLRRSGGAVLLISFDLDELLELSDRIVVLYRGQIVAAFRRDQFDKDQIGLFMVRGEEAA